MNSGRQLWMLKLLLIFIQTVHQSCGQYPTISFISKEKVVHIGDPLELKCSVEYASSYPVHWLRTDIRRHQTHFISKGSSLIINNPRFDVIHRKSGPESSEYTLRISKVHETDQGRYECQIVAGASGNTIRGTVDVRVRIPPVISDNSTRSVITSVGSDVVLYCHAAGYPPPKISWRRERNKLLPNGGGATFRGHTLTIRNITKHDRGTYYCVADNGVIPGHRRAIGVEVEFPPDIKIGRERYGQALQRNADLHCEIEAFPSPSITWLKNGEQLANNQHYQVSVFSKSDEFASTTLRVKRIEKKQYGDYYCQATNKLGSNEKRIVLEETVNAICPPACDDRLAIRSDASNFYHNSAIIIVLFLNIIFIRFV